MSEEISPVISDELARLEDIVRRGQQTFIEVGRALATIQEGRLYRQGGHATFEDYCFKRWGWSRSIAYRYISASQVVENVLPTIQSGPSLTQAVELSRLNPDQQREVAASLDFNSATVAQVRQAVKERKEPPMIKDLRESAPDGARFYGDPLEPVTHTPGDTRDEDRWDVAFRALEEAATIMPRAGRKDLSCKRLTAGEKKARLATARRITAHLEEWRPLLENVK